MAHTGIPGEEERKTMGVGKKGGAEVKIARAVGCRFCSSGGDILISMRYRIRYNIGRFALQILSSFYLARMCDESDKNGVTDDLY